MRGRIGHVQLTDNDGSIDRHLALGEGSLDLPGAFGFLAELGYEGCVAIELSDRQAQLRSLAHLQRLFG